MTKPKSRKTAPHPIAQRSTKSASRKRSAAVMPKPNTKPSTKHARIVAMLSSPAGATVARMMAATDWQQHSVRGFLAGVVRKKLGLNLVSELTDKGRVYRLKDSHAGTTGTTRTKPAV
jgi:hypothetical protein